MDSTLSTLELDWKECLIHNKGESEKHNNIELNRKVLADLAMNHPEAFKAVLNKVK
jgi:ribosomal protein L20